MLDFVFEALALILPDVAYDKVKKSKNKGYLGVCVFIITLFLVLLGGIVLLSDAEQGNYEKAYISRVIDGDTLEVTTGSLEKYKVRLIGVNCAEADTIDGDKATEYVKDILHEGDIVWLERDVSEVDRYDRLLRYVWISDPEALSESDIGSQMLNGILIADGHAKPARYPPDTKYDYLFSYLADMSGGD